MLSEKGKRRMIQAGITPSQCRAARAVLGWSQEDLAERARVSRGTLMKFETGLGAPHANNLVAIRGAFEAIGFQFEVRAESDRVGMSYREDWKATAQDDGGE